MNVIPSTIRLSRYSGVRTTSQGLGSGRSAAGLPRTQRSHGRTTIAAAVASPFTRAQSPGDYRDGQRDEDGRREHEAFVLRVGRGGEQHRADHQV